LDLFVKNLKGWSHKLEILCTEQSGPALKKVENNKFIGAALLCANILQIFYKYLQNILQIFYKYFSVQIFYKYFPNILLS